MIHKKARLCTKNAYDAILEPVEPAATDLDSQKKPMASPEVEREEGGEQGEQFLAEHIAS